MAEMAARGRLACRAAEVLCRPAAGGVLVPARAGAAAGLLPGLTPHRISSPAQGTSPARAGRGRLGRALPSHRGPPVQIEAIYAAEGDPQSAVNRYEAALKESGWGVFAGFGGMHGGFVPSGLAGPHQQYRHKAEGPILMVAVLEGGANVLVLRLRLRCGMVPPLPATHPPPRPTPSHAPP